MMFPYSGKTLETFSKAFPFSSYIPNRVYCNPYGRYVYVNTKGYLHALIPCKVCEDDVVVGYEINDYMLTKDGEMKFKKSVGGWSSTREECIEKILAFHG